MPLGAIVTHRLQLTTGTDFALPAAQGKKAPGTEFLNRFMHMCSMPLGSTRPCASA